MANFEDFLSQNVIRPTYESHNPQGLVLQPSNNVAGDDSIRLEPNSSKHSKGNTNSHPSGMPGYKVLDFTSQKRKRAKFDDTGREKVAGVRKKGACMRCRLLKIPCSGVRPCQSCFRNQASCHERELKHGWMDCIPFSLKHVDIYALDFPSTQDKYNAIISACDFINLRDAERTFEPEILWDLDTISSDCVQWICEEHVNPTSNSRVWMLSSLKCEDLLSDFVHPHLSKALRLLVKTCSILHNWGDNASYSHYSSSDLWSIRSFTGTQVLHNLELILRNNRLATASKDKLKAVFLVLLGVTIAVGYTDPLGQTTNLVEPPALTPEVFIEARQQLLRILAHHMVLIAERVGLLSNDSTNNNLLQKAYRQWNEKAIFEWKVSPDLSSALSSTCVSCALGKNGVPAPNLLWPTLELDSTDQCACNGENYRDAGIQGGLEPNKSRTNGSGTSNNSYRATSPSWAKPCLGADSLDSYQQGVSNADSVFFPEQGLELLDDDFFSNSVREAEPMDIQHRALPNVFGETVSNADATFDGICDIEPFVYAAGASDSHYQVLTCSPARTQGMSRLTPYTYDTWSLRAAPNIAADIAASEPSWQYPADAFDDSWLSTSRSDASPYEGCSMVFPGDTAFDLSYSGRMGNDFARTLTPSKPSGSFISSQKLGGIGWADPTSSTDSSIAMCCTDGREAAPIDKFENLGRSSPAGPAVRERENPHKNSKVENAGNSRNRPASCIKRNITRSTCGPCKYGRRCSLSIASQFKPNIPSLPNTEVTSWLQDHLQQRHRSREECPESSETDTGGHMDRVGGRDGNPRSAKRRLPKLLV